MHLLHLLVVIVHHTSTAVVPCQERPSQIVHRPSQPTFEDGAGDRSSPPRRAVRNDEVGIANRLWNLPLFHNHLGFGQFALLGIGYLDGTGNVRYRLLGSSSQINQDDFGACIVSFGGRGGQVSLQNWEGDVPRRSCVLASCYILNVWSLGSIRTKTQARKDVISKNCKDPSSTQHVVSWTQGEHTKQQVSMHASKAKSLFLKNETYRGHPDEEHH